MREGTREGTPKGERNGARSRAESRHPKPAPSQFEAIGQTTARARRTAPGLAAAEADRAGALACARRGRALTEPNQGRRHGPPADLVPPGPLPAKRPAVARRPGSAEPGGVGSAGSGSSARAAPRRLAAPPAQALARYSYRTSRISYSRVPPGAATLAISPALRLMSARAIGLDTEIFPARISASSSPTI